MDHENYENNGRERLLRNILICSLLILAALFSFLFVAGRASSPQTHEATVTSIDEKIGTVLRLTASSTIASAGISAIPGDTATPIAEKLADFSEYFLLILSVLYAEKYLLTIIGAGAFKILLPAACVIAGLGLFWNPRALYRLAVKFAFAAIALYLVIPLSIRVSDLIYDAYSQNIEATIESAENLSEETGLLMEAGEDQNLISRIMERLTESAEGLTQKASDILNRFIETLAVMIVTSCVIPILVLLFFLWIIRLLTGIEITVPVAPPLRRHGHGSADQAPAEGKRGREDCRLQQNPGQKAVD